jgi:cytoplasmic iron level regulating protein YaaA (DUF328/UPF0246 family)
MPTILLHSSKTMRQPHGVGSSYQKPQLLEQANELATYLQTLSPLQLARCMNISKDMAVKTQDLLASWSLEPSLQQPAIDTFLGDIYSGFQTQTLNEADRAYANDHLYILSGLYGVLRALDSIHPYRLELAYKLPDQPYKNLYKFWGDTVAKLIPKNETIVDLSSLEYSKVILPYLKNPKIIQPKFMTVDSATNEPKFVTVHAKVARGAYARWMIINRVQSEADLLKFNDIGYIYDPSLGTPDMPVFVCKEFGGIGLSVRLT